MNIAVQDTTRDAAGTERLDRVGSAGKVPARPG